MKKLAAVGIIILFVFTLFAVTVNPSLDGRAVVADRGVFPSGNYGKAPGYLPGDTVIVTNHSTGFELEVMILSTSDASEGIAIMLSPEAAEKLNITKGKDVYVKIQKKQAVPFEKVLTAAENETGKDIAADPDNNPSKVLESSPELLDFVQESKINPDQEEPKVVEIIPEEEPAAEAVETSEEESKPIDEAVSDEEIPVIDEAEEEKAADGDPLLEDILIPKDEESIPVLEESELLPPEQEEIEEIDESVEDQKAEEETENADEITENAEEAIDEVVELEEGEVLEITEEEYTGEAEPETPSETEPVEDILLVEEKMEVIEEISLSEEDIAAVEEDVSDEETEVIEVTPLTEEDIAVIEEDVLAEEKEELIEEIPLSEETIAVVEQEELIEMVEEPIADDSAVEDSIIEDSIIEDSGEPGIVLEEAEDETGTGEPRNIFEEIVGGLGEEIPELVPSDDNPPVVTDEEEVIFITPVETVIIDEPEDVYAEIEDYKKMIIESESLVKNMYYIQIATLQEAESIETVVGMYGEKYPMSLIQNGNKYQVLVGPFTDDEYAAVFERFRQKEFKDAFIKKVR